jgi:hypothetical protein
MDIGLPARLRTFAKRLELRIRLDSSVSICACDPLNPTSQTEEDVRANRPNSLPAVVIVETEIIARWRTCGAGTGNKQTTRFCEDWNGAARSPVWG